MAKLYIPPKLFAALRHELNTIRRIYTLPTTAPGLHIRKSPTCARVDNNCTALRRAVLGTQFVL